MSISSVSNATTNSPQYDARSGLVQDQQGRQYTSFKADNGEEYILDTSNPNAMRWVSMREVAAAQAAAAPPPDQFQNQQAQASPPIAPPTGFFSGKLKWIGGLILVAGITALALWASHKVKGSSEIISRLTTEVGALKEQVVAMTQEKEALQALVEGIPTQIADAVQAAKKVPFEKIRQAIRSGMTTLTRFSSLFSAIG